MNYFQKILYFLFLFSLVYAFSLFAEKNQKPRKCILVFGAHADDVESLAGGTFAKFIDEGYEAIYVDVINNTAGCLIEKAPGKWDFVNKVFINPVSRNTFPAGALETIQMRTEEALKAAAVFGATPVFFNFRETWFWQGRKQCYNGSKEFYMFNPPGRQLVSVATRLSKDINDIVELLRKYQPEITIMHTLGGEKHDHGNSAYLMYLAFKQAMSRDIPVGKLWMRPRGWFLETEYHPQNSIKADVKIDVSDFNDIKFSAWNQHLGQNGGIKGKGINPDEWKYEEFITVIDNMK